jgi:bacterioferritin-associated ferredoxin
VRSGNKADLVLILCHCNIVSDRCVRAAVADGAVSVDDVGRACAAGTHCGGCRPSIAALLATLLAGEQDKPAA